MQRGGGGTFVTISSIYGGVEQFRFSVLSLFPHSFCIVAVLIWHGGQVNTLEGRDEDSFSLSFGIPSWRVRNLEFSVPVEYQRHEKVRSEPI